MEQRSEEWLQARCGCATASRIADIIARTKTGWGASRANYAAQLVAERLTGVPAETYTNAAMQWGVDKEADARTAYMFDRNVRVEECGFYPHPVIAMSGASPDGLVGEDGLAEFKCPQTATHIDTLRSGKVPEKYIAQMQWQMACTGRKWCDWVSYDPRMSESMQLFIRRVFRDDAHIAELEGHVTEFLGEVDRTVAELRERYESEPVNLLRAG